MIVLNTVRNPKEGHMVAVCEWCGLPMSNTRYTFYIPWTLPQASIFFMLACNCSVCNRKSEIQKCYLRACSEVASIHNRSHLPTKFTIGHWFLHWNITKNLYWIVDVTWLDLKKAWSFILNYFLFTCTLLQSGNCLEIYNHTLLSHLFHFKVVRISNFSSFNKQNP